MPLNDSKLRGIKASGKVQKISDGGGLYIHVTEKGSMLWRMAYRFGGKQKTLSFGAYPAVSLSQARLLREQARQKIAAGEDPGLEKKELKAKANTNTAVGMTFKQAALEWFGTTETRIGESKRKNYMGTFKNYLFPELSNSPLDGLKPKQILETLLKIKSPSVTPVAASLADRVYKYAVHMGYAEVNPAAGLSSYLPKHEEEHRAAILDPAEFGRLLSNIEQSSSRGPIKYALRLLPYVFLRSGELRCGRWDEIDWDGAMWTIPGARMKTGHDHAVPLARQVLTILEEWRGICPDGTLMFPGSSSRAKAITDVGLLNALRALGYERDEVCIHGFRSTASTLLNSMGYNPDAIEAQLAHKEHDRVRAAYNRGEYMDQRRKMMQAWADYLDKLREEANGHLQK